MPELPEVETIKNVLKPILISHKINDIDVLRKSTIVGDPTTFVNTLKGKTFLDITRIGKFLIFHLSDDVVFISHLRMEGKYFECLESENNTKYARVVFHLDNNHKICYDDSRCFGMMKLSNEKEYNSVKDISSLGPEPFNIKDPKYLFNKYRKINKPIKSTLLDQTIMTGLGNIYADEVLFACKLHPLTPARLLNIEDCENIIKHSQRILNDAIKLGGSTIKSYHPGKDIDGNFQTNLKAYGKKDEECPICHSIMRFKKVGGRGSTYCPHCQVKRGKSIKIAIYGPIASGKSSVMGVFKKNGISVISSDNIVHDLYQQPNVISHIQTMFEMEKQNELDINQLRSIISSDIKKKKQLEKYIHPLVKKEIETFLDKDEDILVVEVPLLFESKLDSLFDYLIAIDAPKEQRLERLKIRNKGNENELIKLNENNLSQQKKKNADYLITNDNKHFSCEKEINEIINTMRYRLK